MPTSTISISKEPNIITTIARNTSCNRGWLRVVVQVIFGTLIVSSFFLIMLAVIAKSPERQPFSRCSVSNCRITCHEAPFYGDYEDDIINAASEADLNCDSIVLRLNQPTFKNFQIPENWLSRIRANVHELNIVGGNMKLIAPHAFLSQFSNNIRIIIFEEIELEIWENNMFVGLSNLKKLFLIDCMLRDIRQDALTPIDDNLKFLDIKAGNIWDPVNVTGSSRLLQLAVVDFSLNNFRNILRNESFSMLKTCRVLYLNSCQIVSLEPGTFDYLEKIEMLYLNDNFLVTVPVGLFDRILPHSPRIALEENHWLCDCSVKDLRIVTRRELLIVDPICHYPQTVSGMTFTDFEGYCNINHAVNDVGSKDHLENLRRDPGIANISHIVYMNGNCHRVNLSISDNHQDSLLRVITPSQQNCLLNRISKEEVRSIPFSNTDLVTVNNTWLRPVYFVENKPYSMIEIASSSMPGYGLLWYQSSCLEEVYCMNTVPNILKVFNIGLGNHFTFCLFDTSSSVIQSSNCITFNLGDLKRNHHRRINYHELIMYICISLACLLCGALCVYALIQRNPSLLKGNKRVIVVKHRSIEALVLPPKLPVRNILDLSQKTKHFYDKNKIFLTDTLTCQNFSRSVSMKSNESNDASYISALQPTEEQLAEWRSNKILKEFDNTSSSDFKILPYSNNDERESLPYYTFLSDEKIYQVPK